MQTIVMIHGFRGTHHGLAKIVAELEGDFTLHVPDLPGFGEGERLEDYTIDSYVSWLQKYIETLQLAEPPILLGHSFGSIITSAFAAQHPQTIRKLILVNPIGAPALEGPRGILTKLAVGYYAIGRMLPEKLAYHWLSSKLVVYIMSTTMAKTNDKNVRSWIHQQHYTHFSSFHSARSVSQAFTVSVSHSVRDYAERITVPTLMIAGEKDDITAVPTLVQLQKSFNNAQLVVIPNVGHLTHYEKAAEVAAAVKKFIA